MQNHSTPGRHAYWLRGPGPTGGVFPTPQPSLPRGAPPAWHPSASKPTHPVPRSYRGSSSVPVARRMLLVCLGPPEQGKAPCLGPRVHIPSGFGASPAKSGFACSLCKNKTMFMCVILPPPCLTGKAVSWVSRGLLDMRDPHFHARLP